MVEIFMVQHEEGNISNFQSIVGRYDSFEDYLKQELEDRETNNKVTFIERHIDKERKTVMAKFWFHLENKDMIVVHFAQQIGR